MPPARQPGKQIHAKPVKLVVKIMLVIVPANCHVKTLVKFVNPIMRQAVKHLAKQDARAHVKSLAKPAAKIPVKLHLKPAN
jgi:hypothetical protein